MYITQVSKCSCLIRHLHCLIHSSPCDWFVMVVQGTIRLNLDPFSQWTDEEIADALERSALDPSLANKSISKGGENLSAGERWVMTVPLVT